jgi:GT2 family glycosyltransferase
MRCTILIPTCHRNDLLARCLERLAPGGQMGARLGADEAADYEVLVSDDGSATTAQAMIEERFPWARWIAGPRRGPACNRNYGARHAQGDWLLFLDDDCLPDAGYVAGYLQAMAANPGLRVLEGRTYADRPRRTLAESAPLNERGGFLWSCNFAILKSVFEAMGGFEERFPFASMEDVEFRQRLRRCSEPFAFVPAASVCHPWRLTNAVQERTRYEASVRVLLQLHPEMAHDFHPLKLLKNTARQWVRSTLPGLWRFRGAGVLCALREHQHALGMAWRFAIKPGGGTR